MNQDRIFTKLTQADIASHCSKAQRRIVLACPGISEDVASVIIRAASRPIAIKLVLDCNSEVFRLGYGNFKAIQALTNAGIEISQSPGLRAGVLIVDNFGWSFTTAPLCVEDERQTSETPNAVRLCPQQLEMIAEAIGSVKSVHEQSSIFGLEDAEIGNTKLTETEVRAVEADLAVAPPVPFDLQRQTRVFQPYIQYVELSLQGASIRRKTISLPAEIAPLVKDAAVQSRIKSIYSLLDEKSKITDKHLQDDLNRIRKDFTHHSSHLGGSVMLRSKTKVLETRLEALRADIEKYKVNVQKRLEAEIQRSLAKLKKELIPLVVRRPPAGLISRCMGDKPTKEEVSRWVESQLLGEFPTVEEVITGIKFQVTYKDLTFSNLNKPELAKELKQAFPAIDWNKPFEEFNAAKEKAASRTI